MIYIKIMLILSSYFKIENALILNQIGLTKGKFYLCFVVFMSFKRLNIILRLFLDYYIYRLLNRIIIITREFNEINY